MKRIRSVVATAAALFLLVGRSMAEKAGDKGSPVSPQPPASAEVGHQMSEPLPNGSQSPPPEVQREIEQSRAAEERSRSLRAAAKAHPKELQYHIDWLSGLLELGMSDQAILVAPEVVEAFPRSSDAFSLFGRALIREGSFDLARLQFQRAIALDGSNAGARAGLAKLDMMGGDLKGAEAGFRKALALDIKRQDARVSLANLLERSGRFAEAISILGAGGGPGAVKTPLTGRRALLQEFVKQPPLVAPERFSGVTVPFKTLRGYPPLVSVKVGEVFEKLFVVDTASEEVVLTSESARALGIPEKGHATIKDEEGREYPTPAYVVLDCVAIGGASVKRVPARVAPGLRYPREQIAGSIGRELLSRFRPVLDYPAKTLTLGRADGPPLAGEPFDLAGAILIEGYRRDRSVGKFVLDTSSFTPGALDFRFVASETGLHMLSEEVKPLPEGPYLFKFQMPSLKVGGVEFLNFRATAVDLRMMSRQLGVSLRGVIGNSFLRDCRLEIDFKSQHLSLKRVKQPAQSPEANAG